MKIKALEGQRLEELSMIEVAHAILEQENAGMTFKELLNGVQSYLGKSDADVKEVIARFYRELNTDGSFIPIDGKWALRAWYAIDSVDEETISLDYFEEDDIVDDSVDPVLLGDDEEPPVVAKKAVEEIVYDEETDDEAVEVSSYDEDLQEVDIDAEIPEEAVVDISEDDDDDFGNDGMDE